MAHKWDTGVPVPSYASTEEEARELLHYCLYLVRQGRPIGFDTETFGKKLPFKVGNSYPLDWMSDTVTFWSLSFQIDDGEYQRWCIDGEYFRMFIPLLEHPDAIFVMWNAKYDTHIAWNCGINMWNATVIDVMVMAMINDENIQGRAGLKDCARRDLGIRMVKFKDLFNDLKDENGKPLKVKEHETSLFDLPRDRVVYYASLDAYATLRLYELYRAELEGQELFPEDPDSANMFDYFLDVEVPTTRMLWRMERRGLYIDRAHLQKQIPLIDKEIEKTEKSINREVGKVVNINSPKQLAAIFFGPKDEGGMALKPVKLSDKTQQPSCDEEVMNELELKGVELAALVVKTRKLYKTRSTYLMAILNLANYFDGGRIHPSFNQMGARTGRFSTSTPNSQNMPRPDNDQWGIRQAFIPEPGNLLIVADYGQLEMRIMAHMSGDRRMIEAIREDRDLHCFTASYMYDVPYDAVMEAKKAEERTPEQDVLKGYRQDAKTIGFGILYGAGPVKIGKSLGIDKKEARKKINTYLNKVFPGVESYIKETQADCYRDGFVRTISGRRRRLGAAIRNDSFAIRSHAEREAVNATIQGSAADIVKNAMIRIDECPVLNRLHAKMLNQIHDELVIEVPEQYAEEAAEYVRHYMEHPFGDDIEALCVSLPVDLKIVTSWDQAK